MQFIEVKKAVIDCDQEPKPKRRKFGVIMSQSSCWNSELINQKPVEIKLCEDEPTFVGGNQPQAEEIRLSQLNAQLDFESSLAPNKITAQDPELPMDYESQD